MDVFTRSFPGLPEQVAEARHWVDDVLTTATSGPGVPDDTIATAVLLLSELCTNVIRYSRSGKQEGRFTVRLVLTSGELEARVADNGAAASVRHLTDCDPDTEGGRGLRLALHFADELGALPNGRGMYYRLVWDTAPASEDAPVAVQEPSR
ncbi:ATP-binding protein [Nocardiopsis gilva YIM 90087]|uniref:ATP-binding protein n=1 Tax=Nocardiopsis gilva YIM 90087 TaxID=1235441 RepID=A0A223S6B2_9ACTN|nr:ATP-binding protein [Nocardiopsis gilva]ASU83638.1 ATP-binding protein [Nocardiopsis gilva YIM 90087]